MTDPTVPPVGGPRGFAPALDLLAGRVLAMASRGDAETVAARVPLDGAGLVITGEPKLGALARLRSQHPGLVLAQDQAADRDWHATPAEPFSLGEPDLFSEPSLDRILDAQLEAGASFALTPTRHIRTKDSASLKAVQLATAGIRRSDMVVRVPVDAGWARPDGIRQLIAVLSRIEHPVALSFASTRDPMEGRGVVAAVRDLTLALPHVALWYSDLSAVAHICDGGLAGAVGFVPSLRHGAIPGKTGFARDKYDKTPHILVPGWLRYMQGSKLEERFASSEPPHCACVICDGRPLDRFSGSDADRLQAHAHNVAALMELSAQMHRAPADQRLRWWHAQLMQAGQLHREAEETTGQSLPMPPTLAAWMRLHGIAS